MPNVYSKFHPYILPTYEKVTRWYEGLSSESESDEQETLSYFRQDARLTFYTLKDRKFVAYKK